MLSLFEKIPELKGFVVTSVLLGISSVTLSRFAIACTAFSGLATGSYTLWKWYHHRKEKKQKQKYNATDNSKL